jgi:hypothetical protein
MNVCFGFENQIRMKMFRSEGFPINWINKNNKKIDNEQI